MDQNVREKIRQALLESYKHREGNGDSCAICGSSKDKLAYHVIEVDQAGVVNGSGMLAHGSLPVCVQCAPPCKKCGLPILTKKVRIFLKNVKGNDQAGDIHAGLGICHEHFHPFA